MNTRCCSRTACKKPPVYTLTYVYRDSTAVLGPLAVSVEFDVVLNLDEPLRQGAIVMGDAAVDVFNCAIG